MRGFTTAAEHELEAHQRFVAARDCLDAMVCGHWPPEPEIAAGVVRLVAAGERRLRWAEAARRAAA